MTISQFYDQLNLCPPWLCRVMAVEKGSAPYRHTKHGWMPVPLDRLVKQSGMKRRAFQTISFKESWDGMKLGDIVKFCEGCRVDPFDTAAIGRFMQEHGEHLFELAPHRISRNKLRQLDERLAKKLDVNARYC